MYLAVHVLQNDLQLLALQGFGLAVTKRGLFEIAEGELPEVILLWWHLT